MKRSFPPSDAARPAGARALAALVLAAGIGLAAGAPASGAWDAGRAPVPFAWIDVALVHVLCALPLAGLFAAFVYDRLPAAGAVAVAALALGAGIAPLADDLRADVVDALRANPLLGTALRAGAAFGFVAGALLGAAVLASARRPTGAPRLALVPALLGIAALVLPPATYTTAHCRHDAAELGELLDQSRLGEARELARGLLVLDTDRTWNGRPLSDAADEIERAVADLEARVAVPLRTYAPTRERFDRARTLAMLGRTDDALAVLEPVDDPGWTAEVESLRGTIHETRGEWGAGLTAYRAARRAWEWRPESPARAAGVLRAATGVAYCLRKAGRYAEAEGAYQEVLALAPTADSHFLLAQFYEDAQQAGRAREHARRAIELSPDRYGRDGERLIRKLTVFQFGCLGVFDAEGRSVPTAAPEGGADRIR